MLKPLPRKDLIKFIILSIDKFLCFLIKKNFRLDFNFNLKPLCHGNNINNLYL